MKFLTRTSATQTELANMSGDMEDQEDREKDGLDKEGWSRGWTSPTATAMSKQQTDGDNKSNNSGQSKAISWHLGVWFLHKFRDWETPPREDLGQALGGESAGDRKSVV